MKKMRRPKGKKTQPRRPKTRHPRPRRRHRDFHRDFREEMLGAWDLADKAGCAAAAVVIAALIALGIIVRLLVGGR